MVEVWGAIAANTVIVLSKIVFDVYHNKKNGRGNPNGLVQKVNGIASDLKEFKEEYRRSCKELKEGQQRFSDRVDRRDETMQEIQRSYGERLATLEAKSK